MNQSKLDRTFRDFVQKGNSKALSKVFDLAAPELLRTATALASDVAEAEDAVQATFLVAIEKGSQHDPGRPVMAWLVGILTKQVQKERARAGLPVEAGWLGEQLQERNVEGPQQVASGRELRRIVEREVQALPETYRRAVRRHLIEGVEPKDNAADLGISLGALHVRLHRGVRLLRSALPAGVATGLGLGLIGTKGLSGLRGEVFERAGLAAPSTVAGTGLWATIGGKALAASAALVVVGGASLGVAALVKDEAPSEIAPLDQETDLASEESHGAKDPMQPNLASTRGATRASSPGLRHNAASEVASITNNDDEYWLELLSKTTGYTKIQAVGARIRELPDQQAQKVMESIYGRLPEASQKQQILKAFHHHGGAEYVLHILHLGAIDGDAAVRESAFAYLEQYALRSFADNREAYGAWRESTQGLSRTQVLLQSIDRFAQDLRLASTEEAIVMLNRTMPTNSRTVGGSEVDLHKAFASNGTADLLAAWLESPDPALVAACLHWLPTVGANEETLRGVLLPALDATLQADQENEVPVDLIVDALDKLGGDWIASELLSRLETNPSHWIRHKAILSVIAANGTNRTAVAVATLMERIDSPNLSEALSRHLMTPITGRVYKPGRDAQAWFQWLEQYQ